MIIKYFAIRDLKSAAYMQLFPSQSFGTAERDFANTVNNQDSMISKYPEDFELFYVGDFNDETGDFNTSSPQHVASAVNLLKSL